MGCCSKVIHGAVGLAKVALSVDLADERTIEHRRAICRTCEHAVPCRKKPQRYCRCARCGCWLKPKTQLKGEQCPVGKW